VLIVDLFPIAPELLIEDVVLPNFEIAIIQRNHFPCLADNLEVFCDTLEEIKSAILKEKDAGCNLTFALSWTRDVNEGNGHIGIVTGVARAIEVDFEVVDIFISEFEDSLLLRWLNVVDACFSRAQNVYVATLNVRKVAREGLWGDFSI